MTPFSPARALPTTVVITGLDTSGGGVLSSPGSSSSPIPGVPLQPAGATIERANVNEVQYQALGFDYLQAHIRHSLLFSAGHRFVDALGAALSC